MEAAFVFIDQYAQIGGERCGLLHFAAVARRDLDDSLRRVFRRRSCGLICSGGRDWGGGRGVVRRFDCFFRRNQGTGLLLLVVLGSGFGRRRRVLRYGAGAGAQSCNDYQASDHSKKRRT